MAPLSHAHDPGTYVGILQDSGESHLRGFDADLRSALIGTDATYFIWLPCNLIKLDIGPTRPEGSCLLPQTRSLAQLVAMGEYKMMAMPRFTQIGLISHPSSRWARLQ